MEYLLFITKQSPNIFMIETWLTLKIVKLYFLVEFVSSHYIIPYRIRKSTSEQYLSLAFVNHVTIYNGFDWIVMFNTPHVRHQWIRIETLVQHHWGNVKWNEKFILPYSECFMFWCSNEVLFFWQCRNSWIHGVHAGRIR